MSPKISIITPVYNSIEFLESTIQSVISQNYTNLEYIIVDGGSTDGSVEIIKKYERYLAYWVSEPDNGPACAINKGLKVSTGDWINWLNSDDLLLPGALNTLARIIELVPRVSWIVGQRLDIDRTGNFAVAGHSALMDVDVLFLGGLFFPQDATFFSRELLQKVEGALNEECKSVFDTELYSRFISFQKPLLTPVVLSSFRKYEGQISSDKRLQTQEGAFLEKYYVSLPWKKRLLRKLKTNHTTSLLSLIIYLCIRLNFFKVDSGWRVAAPTFSEPDFAVKQIQDVFNPFR